MAGLAKLTRPRLHQVVPRERLFERLDEACRRPLAWIVGPPGAGKTSLVASYVEARKRSGVWYHVDGGDRDLATFFHYLTEAAANGTKKKVPPLPVLTPDHRGDLPGFARLYCRALFARIRSPALIVLDNYHELAADAELHALIEPIAREVPEDVCVLAISRVDPPPSCAQLRAVDRLAVIDWDELRLTLDETRRIAALRHALDEPALAAVHESAGGWPVGLTLTLEQMRRGAGGPAALEAGGREVLFNYFAAQLFQALPGHEREQLMRIALLPRATAAQAAGIAGDDRAGPLLESLYRRRLFVDRRGDAYQFHDLFRAFLVSELERTRDVASLSALRADAARLLDAHGEPEPAFGLAAAAAEWPLAVQLVLKNAPKLFEQGRAAVLRDWLAAMPAALVESTPWMGLWLGVALSPVVPLQARTEFEKAYPRFAPDDALGRTLCAAAIVFTFYLEFDNNELDQWLDELIPLVESRPPYPAPAAELRVNTALLFGLSFRRPTKSLVDRTAARMRELLLHPSVPVNARVDAAALLLAHHAISAQLDEAARVVAMVEPWLSDPKLTPNYRALWMLQVAHYQVKHAQNDDAEASYDLAEAIVRDNALTLLPLHVYVHVGRCTLALMAGDVDRAEAERARAASFWTFTRRIDSALDTGMRALVASHRGEVAEALSRAREQYELMDAAGPVWMRYYGRIHYALALVDAGRPDEVQALLDRARSLLVGTSHERLVHALDCVAAYAAVRAGDAANARAALERFAAGANLDVGKFYLRMHPRALPTICAAALEHGIEVEYVRRIVRELGLRAPTIDAPNWPWPFEVRTLGRFEVLCEGRPLAFSRKVPKKTLALLKALVALGNGTVSEQRLIDVFWPDEEGDAAARALDATVLRLRALLGDAAAIVQKGGKVSVDLERVWIDVFAFERALSAAGPRLRDSTARTSLERALELYGGAFLPQDEADAWTVATRERLRGKFINAVGELAAALEGSGDFDGAIAAYLRGLDADAVVEPFYQGLMRCYGRLDRRTEAIAAYRRLKQILSVTLGLAPSAATEKLYQSLREPA